MIAFLSTRLGKLVAALVAAAGILLATFSYGRKAEREDQIAEDNADYIDTTKEITNVEVSTDPDDAFKRLRDNGWVR
jgi:hypothetical protein